VIALGALGASVGALWFGAPSTVGAGTPSSDIVVRKMLPRDAPSDATFTVTVTCDGLEDQPLFFSAPLGGVQLANVPNNYDGSCTITETATAGATPSYSCSGEPGTSVCETADGPDPTVLSITNPGAGQVATVTVTNTFPLGGEPGVDPAAEALEAAPSFTG
jgi:hypothetical protein